MPSTLAEETAVQPEGPKAGGQEDGVVRTLDTEVRQGRPNVVDVPIDATEPHLLVGTL